MKKRFKLFATIASLCLAVALMAFGVYAATSISLTVSGNVGFTASGINGSWAFKSATVTGGTFEGGKTTLTSSDFTASGEATAKTGSLPQLTLTAPENNGVPTATITITAEFTMDGTVAANLSVAGSDTTTVKYTEATQGAVASTAGTPVSVSIKVTITAPNDYEAFEASYSVTFTAEP